MRRQIVTDNVNAPIGFARSSASIQPRTDSLPYKYRADAGSAHLLQYAVGQLVLLDTLDDVYVYVIIKNLVQAVEEAAHTQSVRREFTVAGNDEDLCPQRKVQAVRRQSGRI